MTPNDPASAAHVPEPPPSEELVLKKRSAWPVLAVLFAIFGGGGGALYWYLTRPDPLKVLVAIDVEGQWWDGSKPAATLADRVGEGLTNVGFEPIKGGDPKVDKILSKSKTPEEAARKLGAGYLITGTLAPEIIEHPVEGKYIEVRTKAVVSVRYIGDPAGKSDDAEVSAWSGGPTRDEALDALARNMSDRVLDVSVPRITGHRVIHELLDGDLSTMVKLAEAKKYVEARARRLDRTKKLYEKADQEHAEGSKAPLPITYYASFAADDLLGGIGERGMLVRTADVTPFIIPSSLDLGWINHLETVAWRDPDRRDTVVWSGYHILGYPAVAPEGAPIVFVEDMFGWAKTLTVVDADGTSRRVRIDPKARFDNPIVAPKGAHAAMYLRPCRSCKSNVAIVSLKDGKTVFERVASAGAPGDESLERYGGLTFLDANRLAYLVAPTVVPSTDDGAEAPAQELRVVDLSRDPPEDGLALALGAGERCEWPTASSDGRVLVATCSSGQPWELTVFDLDKKEHHGTGVPGYQPSLDPAGARVVFAKDGDIFLLELATQKVTPLTSNEFEEVYPRFSRDGKTAYFESRMTDPAFDRRASGVVASVVLP
jgi:hypothetical protein